ncbi:MAG TPA: chalcone isomerase family protein [Zeimonas sp.]
MESRGRPGAARAGRSTAALATALALACGFGNEAAGAAEVAGVELAESIELGGTRLQLNGAGERTLYVVRTYVAALYVGQRSAHAQALLGQPGPRRLSLTMLAALSTDWVLERIIAAMRENVREDIFAGLQPRLSRLVEPFLALERLQKGDRVDIDAIDGVTRVSVDGQALGVDVPGEDLFDALLRAFIGERPIDEALERALLGRPGSREDPDT